jgi:hypothetical protein
MRSEEWLNEMQIGGEEKIVGSCMERRGWHILFIFAKAQEEIFDPPFALPTKFIKS